MTAMAPPVALCNTNMSSSPKDADTIFTLHATSPCIADLGRIVGACPAAESGWVGTGSLNAFANPLEHTVHVAFS